MERLTKFNIGNLVASIAGFAMIYISMVLYIDLRNWSEAGGARWVSCAVLDTNSGWRRRCDLYRLWLCNDNSRWPAWGALSYLGIGRRMARFQSRQSDRPHVVCDTLLCDLLQLCRHRARWTLADDSWGRFWGWDPKENGALIIVIWNAIVLHARWDKMVLEKGTAVLSLFGMVVTSWSYFGVNELGIGLHSYGTTEGTLRAMFRFAVVISFTMLLGLLPKNLFGETKLQNHPRLPVRRRDRLLSTQSTITSG